LAVVGIALEKSPIRAGNVEHGVAAIYATGGVAEVVTNLQSYIKRLGKADLHRLIDTL
jgi:hypothetical protein